MKRFIILSVFLLAVAGGVSTVISQYIAPDYMKGVEAYEDGNYTAALNEFEPLAKEGHSEAQYYMAEIYLRGRGVVQDNTQAREWFRRAAEQGLAQAQTLVGYYYYSGEQVTLDFKKAFGWYLLAAEQGDVTAQYKLAHMYEAGQGTPRDVTRAYMWWSLAAELGHELAPKRVTFLEKGLVRLDVVAARIRKNDCQTQNYQGC
ncbi:MAG: tetratricopeptide repeat protein [Halopseudomonas aestusnigri]